ncbi:MAG: putative intracellular septation protein A [Rhodomicrobium sp.]|nr:MAG: putative intracellular septation protein A [Rhodomicrobium sp.]
MIKFLLELAPLLIFFATYKFYGLMEATIALMITTPISLVIFWFIYRRVATMPLITAVLVLVFGGLTLYFNDSFFIKIKPTIIYVLFASGLLGALCFGKSLMKSVLGQSVQLTEAGWFKMSLHWGLFFIALALMNEFVWRNYSEEAWVQFKTFGVLPLTLVFSALELIFIRGEIIEPQSEDSGQ